MRRLTVGCLAICLATISLSLGQNAPQPPATRPASRGRAPSKKEFDDAHKWSTNNMQNLHKLAELPDHRDQYRNGEVYHFHMWASARNDKKALPALMENFKEQDGIYGLVLQWYGTDDENLKSQLQDQINAATMQNVKRLLNERAAKIETMKSQLADQESKLAQDRADIQKLVADRVSKQFLNQSTTRPSGDAPGTNPQTTTPAPPGGTLASPPAP